jgi:hypothetical protein
MLPKLKNERVINMNIKYNTKKVVFHFKSNHIEYKMNNKEPFKLVSSMLCSALSHEQSTYFRVAFREAFKLMEKREKRYFSKLNKLTTKK